MSNQSNPIVGKKNSSTLVRPLFRKQAIENSGRKQYGTVVLARPISHLFLSVFFLLFGVALLTFFFMFSTTRKAHSTGTLLPTKGVIRILPGQAGVITDVRVSEGQTVRSGDVLFVLSGERSSNASDAPQKLVSTLLKDRRDSYNTELKQSRVQVSQRLASVQRRIKDLSAESARIDDQLDLQTRRIALSEQSFQRYRNLNATNYISQAQLQDKQADLLDQEQRLAELLRVKSATQRELASAESDMQDLRVQASRDAEGFQRNISTLEQDLTENEARREMLVRASQDGTVAAIVTEVGQTVSANTILTSLLPLGSQLEAEIYVPSRSVGFIKPGMLVTLRYQAYPYQKFGQFAARVREIANTSMRAEDLGLPGVVSSNGEPLFRIRLTLQKQNVQAYGQILPLKSGMLLDASVLMEKRRLYEWVLEPLFSISGRL